jgi:DNA-binding CsgD family transcriptional regulator
VPSLAVGAGRLLRRAVGRAPRTALRSGLTAPGLTDLLQILGQVGLRSRHELRTAGERSGERRAVSSDILTAQELQIAQLAADGLTNREIGKRLYISHRTVGAHLARIYAKLGATSRVQLHSALSAGREP